MKRLLSILAVVISGSLAVSCNGTASSTEAADSAIQGTWTINYFAYNNQDHTNDFSGYTFSMEKPRTIIAIRGHQNVVGVMRMMDKDSTRKMCSVIFNNIDPKLARLNDEWNVIRNDSATIDLQREKKSGMEHVTFRKDAAAKRQERPM